VWKKEKHKKVTGDDCQSNREVQKKKVHWQLRAKEEKNRWRKNVLQEKRRGNGFGEKKSKKFGVEKGWTKGRGRAKIDHDLLAGEEGRPANAPRAEPKQ